MPLTDVDDAHDQWMRIALTESRLALPDCVPNPPVGCVIVSNGRLIGRGYTNAPGGPHAEVMALKSATATPVGATVYVTLEPCSFHGRTPSCAAALVAAGVRDVYVGIIDPDPRNCGRGLEMLRAGGIYVEVGIVASEIETLLKPYLIVA